MCSFGPGVSAVDYGQKVAAGLEKVYVTISSLDFDDVESCLEEGRQRSIGGDMGSEWLRQISSKSFASRCGSEAELSDVGQLFRGAIGAGTSSCLVVGPAGTGKTVLLQWILTCWATGLVEELGMFEIVVYVSGRDAIAMRCDTPEEMLGMVLQRQYGLSDNERAELEAYLSTYSQRVLVLLDSADEGGEAWVKSKALAMLFERRALADCAFVVTSRPCMQAYALVPLCKERLYMAGFNDRQLDELLNRRLGEEEGSRVAEQLKAKPELLLVRELMKGTPLVANMVAELAKRGAESLPLCTTQIYKAMALDMLQRQQLTSECAVPQDGNVFGHLPEHCQAWLQELGRLALDGFLQRQFVFDMDTVRSTCSEEALRLGFLEEMEVEDDAASLESSHQAEFRHLTWLEFFAAYSLCCDSGADCCSAIKSCIQTVRVEEETEPFWRFVFGLVNSSHLDELVESLKAAVLATDRLSELDKRGRCQQLACTCLAEAALNLSNDSSLEEKSLDVERATATAIPASVFTKYARFSPVDALMLSLTLQHSPHVERLNIGSSELKADHCRALGLGLGSVVHLALGGNPGLHNGGLTAFANAVEQRNAPNLKTISIGNSGLWGEADTAAIASLVSSVPTLLKLWLGQNYLGGVGFAQLQEPLSKSRLTLLDLRDNELDGSSCRVLAEVIASCQHLTDFYIHDNALGNDAVATILKGIERSVSLDIVDLSRTDVNEEVLDAVSACLSQRKTLMCETRSRPSVQISFDGNKLSREALEKVAERMPDGSRDSVFWNIFAVNAGRLIRRSFREHFGDFVDDGAVGELSLSREGVDDEGAAEVAGLINEFEVVVALDLDENAVGNDGAAAFGDALQGNSTLRSLRFTQNQLGAAGFISIVTSLATNSTLIVLDLFGNPIFSNATPAERESAHCAIRQMVGASSVRHCLLLGSTSLGNAECEVIGDALTSDECNQVFLYLSGNLVGDDGAAALCSGLERNSSVKYVDLAQNKISNVGAERVRRCTELRAEQGVPIQVWMEGNQVDPSAFNDHMLNRVSSRLALVKMIENCDDLPFN